MKKACSEIRLTLPGGIEMVLCRVECPKMGFRMGARGFRDSEEPVHTVVIPHVYYMGKYPVTQEQYCAVATRVAELRERSAPSYRKGKRLPVENVSWHEANQFCAALAALVPVKQRPKGHGFFCLPTEAEWEHACRAGTDTEYHTGDGTAALEEAGCFAGNSGHETHEVDASLPNGALPKPNKFGLCHMHGNVWEWCHDMRDDDAYRKRCDGDKDPGQDARLAECRAWRTSRNGAVLEFIASAEYERAMDSESFRVLRGGAFDVSPRACRSAALLKWRADVGMRNLGFRVCWVPGPAALAAASWNQHEAEEPRAPGVGAAAKRAETKGAGGSGATRRPRNATAKTARAAGSKKFVKLPSKKSPSRKPDRPTTRRTARPPKRS